MLIKHILSYVNEKLKNFYYFKSKTEISYSYDKLYYFRTNKESLRNFWENCQISEKLLITILQNKHALSF